MAEYSNCVSFYTMKACEVYVRDDAIYVFSESETVLGWGISSEPRMKLARNASPKVLGEAIVAALNASQKAVPQPEDIRDVTNEVLSFTGFKTWKAFAKNARLFLIAYDGTEVQIIPTVAAEGGAFDHLPDKAIKCGLIPEDIGQTLIDMLSVYP